MLAISSTFGASLAASAESSAALRSRASAAREAAAAWVIICSLAVWLIPSACLRMPASRSRSTLAAAIACVERPVISATTASWAAFSCWNLAASVNLVLA